MKKPTKEFIERTEKELVDQGLIIEAGWAGLRLAAVPNTASQAQLDDMQMCFFAGAQHLFSTILRVLEPGDEPSEKDLQRMDKIQAELGEFAKQFKAKHNIT